MNQNIFCSKCHRIPSQCCCKSNTTESEEEMTKPIAWMASNELLFSVVKDEIYHIPLYTHPIRELTMNPDILPTMEEWRLVCKMVKGSKK
jgi:hypothetical protein